MKRSSLIFALLAFFLVVSVSSCKTGEGCNTDQWQSQPGKDGSFSTKKRGKSGLFSKKEQKKMKKRTK